MAGATDDLTEGSLARTLLALAAPLVLQNLVLAVQQVVDLFWVGRLSAQAVAAMGLVYPLVALLFAVVVFAPFVGTQIVVSQRVGAADDDASGAYATGLWVALAIGAVAGVVAALSTGPLLDLLTAGRPRGAAAGVRDLASSYFLVIALGAPVAAVAETVEGGFVGWGDSRATLYMNLLAVAVNAVLDPLLVFGLGPFPRLEMQGAAAGTVAASLVAALLGLAMVAAGRNGGMLVRGRVFDASTAREILTVGAPAGGQHAARQVAGVVLVGIVFAAGGAPGLAAYVVGARVAGFAYIPAQGLQQAAQSVVGQNLGAGAVARARRTTWVGAGVAVAALAVVGAVQWVVPGAIADLVSPELGAARPVAVTFLRALAVGYPAVAATYLLEAGFNGASRTRVSFAATLCQHWFVRVPLAALVGVVIALGVEAVFWVIVASNVAVAVGLAAYYRSAVADGMLGRAAEAAAGAAE